MVRTLQIVDLHAGSQGKELLKGINLTGNQGEVHAIMGPNGSGTSTLSNIIMGHPKYQIISRAVGVVGGRGGSEVLSGVEKKKAEILKMLVLKPSFAILDETDSGLDIDALKTVAQAIETSRGPNVGILLITHYQRLLKYVKPDFVHVLMGGKIVLTGGGDLAEKLDELGYGWLKDEKYAGA